jgi:HlyD family secretion protein
VERARAQLRQRELTLQERKTSSLAHIDAAIAAVEAQIKDAKWRMDKARELYDRARASDDEVNTTEARYENLTAQLSGLRADRKQAEIAIELAAQDVTLAEKSLESAQTMLGDAEKRLRETKIVSPIDGMISRMSVEVGEVVQGGRTTITGGTVVAVVADISEIYVRTEVSDADIGAVLWLAPDEAIPGGATLARELRAGDAPLNVDTSGWLAEKVNTETTEVKIRVDAFRNEEFFGAIERIFPEPRKAQNIITYLVDIRVTSPNRNKLTLVQGMQADVEFTAQSVTDVILVPHDAIREGPNGRLGVYVPEKVEGERGERPKFLTCRFGLDNGLYAELIQGEDLEEGSRVYTELPPEFGGKSEDED